MKRIVTIFGLLTVFSIGANAQVGNEWINFSQSYFKIPVAKDGIYRLTYSDLQTAGFPVDAVDPKQIQLFHRGVEQSIAIAGESDEKFDNADFIEFYGRKNDGTLDAELYKPATLQPHGYYNLYSDTTSYFLTIGSGAGKRMTYFMEGNTSSLPVESYHIDEKLLVLADQYAGGENFQSEIYASSFDTGEGFTGSQIVQNQSRGYSIPGITQGMTAVGLPTLEILLVGRGVMAHKAEIYVGASLRLLNTVTFSGFSTYKHLQNIAWSDIAADGSLTIWIKVIGYGEIDRLSVSYIKLNYPQQTDAASASAGEKIFALAENTGGKSYIEIANASSGVRLFDISDPANVLQIGATAATTLNAVIPETTTSKKILATSTINTVSPALIKAVSFRQISPAQHDYIIISHPLLRKPALGYDDPVKAYAAYRASVTGGGYDTLVINMQQVYDQFNYGEKSPLAIFHFMKFLSSPNPPKYLFLIGKGMEIWYRFNRQPSTDAWEYMDLVPTSGYPGSDMFYTAGLAGTTYEPAVPTGRLSAMKPEQVAAYLNKVIEMEALPYDALWRKNILHLSGGIEEGEPQAFRSYLQDFQTTAEGYHLGGQVSAIAKKSRDVQVINIADEVNKGLNLITFFGHSSPSTLDFDIGYVSNPVMGYNNTGRYPMLLMNGCEAGAFFLYSTLFGEDWIFADKKGATGFIAHTSFGLVSTLKQYSDIFYQVAYGDSVFIKRGVGDIQKETAKRYMANASSSVINLSQVQQMLLLGDPAVVLFGAPKPDLEINNDNLSIESFDDKAVTALSDSFALKFVVRNFGMAKSDTLRVEVLRTLNDNSTLLYDSLYAMTKYSDTLVFVIRSGQEKGFGNNAFKVTIDPDNIIPELSKDNNTATLTFFIPLNGTKNLFPADFGIVNSDRLSLSFQNTDLLSGERNFIVEVDTVNTFDSPYKMQFTVTGTVLAKKQIEILTQDTLAYYWRTRFAEPLPGESEAWETSSFTYINGGEEGWAQVHFPQYLENQSEGLVKDATLRKLKFQETVTDIDIKTFGSSAGRPRDSVSVKIGGAEYNLYTQEGGAFGCRNNTINLIAFDRRSTQPYVGLYFKWYEILYNYGGRRLVCGREPFVINSFTTTELSTGNNDDLIQYVDNIALGDSVVLYNIGDAGYNSWPDDAKAKLGEFGISTAQLDALQSGDPVVIFGRKGLAPGTAKVYTMSNTSDAILQVNETITGRYTSGSMQSALIGPAQKWESLHSNTREVESVDQLSFDLIGVDLDGEEVTLLDDAAGNQDLTAIDAATYPYLKIVFNTGDDINLTTAQLHNWLVLYTPVPEGLLLPVGPMEQKTVIEGQVWQTQYRFINISEKAFADSLTVHMEVFNQQKHNSREVEWKIESPAPGDTTTFQVSFNTLNYTGLNNVDIFVNPKILPEQYYDNNVLESVSLFNVLTDSLNPVLDVTIDGRYVLNGDFVSPDPFIKVKLWDENRYVLKTDTTGIRMFLTYPCGDDECDATAIYFSDAHVKWYPATDTADLRIEFRPETLPDGNYTLRVEADDSRGNASGTEPFEVNFVVKGETTIAFPPPYPNPLVSEVYIEFTVSGNIPPEAFTMQVIDVNGKSVYDISYRDGVDFYVGKNKITWNGTDAYGNVLPKGVYLYKMILYINGKQYSKQGKLVINR